MTKEERNAYTVKVMEKKLASMHKLLIKWKKEEEEAKIMAAEDPEYNKWHYESDIYTGLIHHGYELAMKSMEFEFELCQSMYVRD